MKIIDFGAGRGAMALALSEEGADVYCVEPFGHERLEALGLRSVPSLSELPGSFRANGIVSLDVIEHLPRPWEDLKRLKGLLTSDGWLYLSTLNINSLNGSLMRSSWREARKEGHIIFFTPASLERVLKHCGWRRYRRLRWLIPYKNVALYRFMQYGLQATGLESGLRYLVWNDGRGYAVHG